jgi:peptidyl-prolyl cis-trans isomerase SurA
MRTGASALRRAGFAAMLACLSPLMLAPAPAQAQTSEIRYVVNNEAITSYDIQRRAAFLRLQNKRGNLQAMAAEEMIDQAVRNAEARRLNIRVADLQVNEAYERFSRTNRMSPAQMDNILNQAGVTKTHFRDFIRAQIGWSQVLSRNSRAGAQMTEQDVVRRMLEQGGSKPTAREYMLQQVIFVVPAAERRAKLGARKREAEALRQRFACWNPSCRRTGKSRSRPPPQVVQPGCARPSAVSSSSACAAPARFPTTASRRWCSAWSSRAAIPTATRPRRS